VTRGFFEEAHGGTLFLDEVAELPLSAQVKLLRVLQDGEIEKIGRTGKINVDARIIAATNKNLANEVMNGKFREDLYYRLNVVPIDIIPLRKRGNDIVQLFNHFLNYFSLDMNIDLPGIDEKAYEILLNYKWPGNVRELRNVVQRLIINSDGAITAKDISNPMILRNHIVKDETNLRSIPGNTTKDMEKIFR
jgi:transcriptional regulator with PAS, ATPase and Fis domain